MRIIYIMGNMWATLPLPYPHTRGIPLGRSIAPVDCADAALFLASDLARNITGLNMPVDAGVTIGPPPLQKSIIPPRKYDESENNHGQD
ncbi:MAG: SDR family oxidoreductase [Rhizomicrobium sp.]